MKVIQKFFIFSFLTVIFVVGIFFMLNINIQIPLYKVADKYSKPDVKWKKFYMENIKQNMKIGFLKMFLLEVLD
ncbi:hypothetical protein AXF11_05765 [Leptotrichia sp. oral taxon 847]|nr:hypothetical protein AXF11_05765 [Leptotrichia sp. oral taxon 847]